MKRTMLLLAAVLLAGAAMSQSRLRDHDSTYYVSYRDRLTVRGYLSRKYTNLRFDPPGAPDIRFRSNTSLNIGVGATYRAITVNLGIGISKFNPGHEKGKTRYLDLQGHLYARSWNVDFLGEFYRGYYLSPKGLATQDGSYYIRKDLDLSVGGIAFYRSLNDRHFSYQAGLVQNEWQRKSAGSLLIGGELYYGSIHADSSLVPGAIDTAYRRLDVNRIHFFQVGPGIGYGYSWVIDQHYFILASATVDLAFRYTHEKSTQSAVYEDRTDVFPNFILHAGAGYNSAFWSLSILWVSTQLNLKGNLTGYQYNVTTGNYRLIYAKRIRLNRKAAKILKPINDVIGQ